MHSKKDNESQPIKGGTLQELGDNEDNDIEMDTTEQPSMRHVLSVLFFLKSSLNPKS